MVVAQDWAVVDSGDRAFRIAGFQDEYPEK